MLVPVVPDETPELVDKVELNSLAILKQYQTHLSDELELRRSPIILLSGTWAACISSFFFEAGMTMYEVTISNMFG